MSEPTTLALLNADLESVRAQREALRNKHVGSTIPEEARAEDEELVKRAKRITDGIEVERQKERDSAFAETARYMDDPQYQISRAVNAEDEGRNALLRAGWNVRNGMVYRQVSGNREVAFCPEEVMFGPIPTNDPVAGKHFQQTRASFQPEYRSAFNHWLKSRGDRTALSSQEQNALSEGIAEGGGYLVPPDMAAEIMARRADASVMRRVATVRQTSRNVYQIPAVAPASSGGSIYSSGFIGGLVGETPISNTDTGPTFEQFEIGIKKFEAYTRVSNDLIADAVADVISFLSTDGGRNLGLVEDNYFINGLGTGLEPRGLLNSGITTGDVEGSTSDHVSNSTSNAGSAPKLIALAYLVPAQYTAGASWLMARQTKGEIHALVDADGRPWWQLAAGAGGAAGAPGTLVDFPVNESPFMPVDGTNGNKVVVVGDLSAYIIAERTSLSVTIDDINLRGSDETQIFIRSRAGGGLWNTDALRIGIV